MRLKEFENYIFLDNRMHQPFDLFESHKTLTMMNKMEA